MGFSSTMFWADRGSGPKIERARLDGSERYDVVTGNMGSLQSVVNDAKGKPGVSKAIGRVSVGRFLLK